MEALKSIKSERGASQWGLVLRLLSLALVTLLAFSSGVWFGKKLSDADYQRVALEGEFGKSTSVASAEDSIELDDTESALDNQEALSEADVAKATQEALARAQSEKASQVGDSAAPATTDGAAAKATASVQVETKVGPAGTTRTVASAQEASQSHSQKPDLSLAQQAAQRVAQNAAPLEADKPKPESRVPAALPKTVGSSGEVEFTVQVAAYPTLDAAKEHSGKLVEKGFPAFPVEAKVNGKTVFRVSVGSFKTQSEAAQFRISLMKQADIAAAFVTKIARN